MANLLSEEDIPTRRDIYSDKKQKESEKPETKKFLEQHSKALIEIRKSVDFMITEAEARKKLLDYRVVCKNKNIVVKQ